jgi:hypothetical protein
MRVQDFLSMWQSILYDHKDSLWTANNVAKQICNKRDVQSLLQQKENIIKAHKSLWSAKGEEDNLGPNWPNTKIGAKAKFIGLLFFFVN